MPSNDGRIEYVRLFLDGVEISIGKGNLVGALHSLKSALLNCLAIPVTECNEIQSACNMLSELDVPALLERHQEYFEKVCQQVDAEEIPSSTLGGNYAVLALAHVAWALGNVEMGEQHVEFVRHPDVLQISTPFWQEYSAAMSKLIGNEKYSMAELSILPVVKKGIG